MLKVWVHKKDVKSVGHSRDEKYYSFHNIGSSLGRNLFLRHFNRQKSIDLVTKTCVWGVSSFSLLR